MANSIIADFRAKLVSDITLYNLVNGRIAQKPIDQDEPVPWIGIGRQSEDQEIDLDGVAGLVTTSFDVDIRSDTPEEADEIARTVKNLLRGFRGDLGDHEVRCIDVGDADNLDEPFPEGSDSKQTTVTLRVEIIHAGP